MKTLQAWVIALVMVCCSGALAKLPPPTPEEQEKAAAAQETAKAAAAEQEEATKRAQDRVAERYIAEQRAKGIIVQPTPVDGPAHAAVTTAQGNTPASSNTGESPEREGADKGAGPAKQDATGPDTSKDSHKDR